MKTIRVFEAFAGIGAQHEGWSKLQQDFPEQVRFEFIGISEIDRYAIASYKAAHGDVPNFGSITDIDWSNVPDFDCLTYSFPCTDISNAGLQKGFSEDSGTRSSLLWECRRAIEAKRPEWLLMENVKALTQKKFRPEFRRWIDWLSEQGYTSYWKVLNSKDYGNPQNRERVFMWSILRTGVNPAPVYNFPKPFPLEKRLKDILETDVDESFYLKPQQVARILEHTEKHEAKGYVEVEPGMVFDYSFPHSKLRRGRLQFSDNGDCVCLTQSAAYGQLFLYESYDEPTGSDTDRQPC